MMRDRWGRELRHLVIAMGLLVLPSIVSAHHSRAEFSDTVEEISGELVAIDWRNPHPDFSVRVTDESGEEKLWDIEGYGSLYTLQRAGVTRETFEDVESVRIAGQVSTRRENALLVTHMLLPDGTQVIFRRDAEPYWTNEAIGGSEVWNADESDVVDTVRENRGIFRVWSIPAQGVGVTNYTPFVEEALKANENYDPLTDFSSRCEPKGMPLVMNSPHPLEFADQGEFYTLQGGDFGSVRTIHIADAQDPDTQPASPLGYSVGHWEGKTLVVETSRINFPYFNSREVPQSEAMHVVERFTLSEDQSRLDYHRTMTDPALFTEPATREQYWLALGEELSVSECYVR